MFPLTCNMPGFRLEIGVRVRIEHNSTPWITSARNAADTCLRCLWTHLGKAIPLICNIGLGLALGLGSGLVLGLGLGMMSLVSERERWIHLSVIWGFVLLTKPVGQGGPGSSKAFLLSSVESVWSFPQYQKNKSLFIFWKQPLCELKPMKSYSMCLFDIYTAISIGGISLWSFYCLTCTGVLKKNCWINQT